MLTYWATYDIKIQVRIYSSQKDLLQGNHHSNLPTQLEHFVIKCRLSPQCGCLLLKHRLGTVYFILGLALLISDLFFFFLSVWREIILESFRKKQWFLSFLIAVHFCFLFVLLYTTHIFIRSQRFAWCSLRLRPLGDLPCCTRNEAPSIRKTRSFRLNGCHWRLHESWVSTVFWGNQGQLLAAQEGSKAEESCPLPTPGAISKSLDCHVLDRSSWLFVQCGREWHWKMAQCRIETGK